MRLRVCILLAAAAGAAGSLILAVDMYRRLAIAERMTVESASAPGAAGLVFGMAHVLGAAGMGILFLAICLLLLAEKNAAGGMHFKQNASASTVEAGGAAMAAHAVSPHLPAAAAVDPRQPAAPKAPFRPAKNIYIVQAPPAPERASPPEAPAEQIGTPIPLTDTEFSRAVVYEKVFQEQGEIPVATPLDSESKIAEAALGGDGAGTKKTPPPTPKPKTPPPAV